jgi:short-subunit dehydrogenase
MQQRPTYCISEAIDNEVRDKGGYWTALCPGATERFQDAADMNESKLVKGRKQQLQKKWLNMVLKQCEGKELQFMVY